MDARFPNPVRTSRNRDLTEYKPYGGIKRLIKGEIKKYNMPYGKPREVGLISGF